MTLKEAVQPLSSSPTTMLGRKTWIGSSAARSRTSRSASHFERSYVL
jgi:hypothetical protein